MNRHIAAVLSLTVLGTTAYAADIYRSTAPDGTVSFSDRPQGADVQLVSVTTPRAQAASRAPAAARGEAAQNPPEAPAVPAPLPDGPTSAELREQRQKNCEVARERLARYELSRRLFRTNEAGEREYLDDAAVAEARAQAAANVEDWCD
jgi:hypothetical protein